MKTTSIIPLFFIILLANCKRNSNQLAEKDITLVMLNSNDKSVIIKNDMVFANNKPFSGYLVEYYPTMQVASKVGYLNGKMEGTYQKWYENGQKMEERSYKQNRKIGVHESWWASGKPKFKYVIDNDIPVGTHYEWYENGQLFSLTNYNNLGQPEGKQQMWYNTGQVKANYVIKDGRRYGFLGAKGCMGEGEMAQSGMKLTKN